MPKAKIGAMAAAAAIAAGLAWIPAFAQEATAPVVAAPAELRYSNKWRIEVSEGANNTGVMRFRITPQGGTPIDIPVQLKKGRGEDGCSRDIKAAFKAALDRKIYKVEGDDEEDVLVKKRKGPDFALELVDSTVRGTRVNLDRE